MSRIITRDEYFNPNGCEILDEKLVVEDGKFNRSGMIDFNRSKYGWIKSIYDLMEANSWFPGEVDTSGELADFRRLTENEQEIYRLTFAQLSFNDSLHAHYLTDFKAVVNNSLAKSAITLQEYQEVNHSKSYAVLLDAAGNSNEVFDLYKHNAALAEKNNAISEQFARNIEGRSSDKILLSSMASVNLEGIYFLQGFGYIFTLGDKVPGARDMVKFIARDELKTHLPLFSKIYKTIIKENKIDTKLLDKSYEMIQEAVDIELKYGKYLTDNFPILGLDFEDSRKAIHNYANKRLKAIGLNEIFPKSKKSYLEEQVDKYSSFNDTKTNFFEGNVTNYSKGSIDMDNF